MRKIVFLDRSTIAPQIRLRRPNFEHELVEHASTRPEHVVERLVGATVAIINKVPLTANVLEKLPDLRLIAVAATGTDCVDKKYCEAHGIAVSNIRGYAVNTVPEHAFALIRAPANGESNVCWIEKRLTNPRTNCSVELRRRTGRHWPSYTTSSPPSSLPRRCGS